MAPSLRRGLGLCQPPACADGRAARCHAPTWPRHEAGGILYASFKYGHGEQMRNGRHFTDLDEAGLADLLKQVGLFFEIETWVTCDRRPGRASERWLNSLLRLEDDA